VYLVVACMPYRVTKSDIGLHGLKHLRKGIVERIMGVLLSHLDRWWFDFHLVSGLDCGEGSTVGTGAALIYTSKQIHNCSSK
jgi:hypothetical protein